MNSEAKSIELTINGILKHFEINKDTTLLELLREKAYFKGSKRGCDSGHCGACTVLLNGKPVNSCCVLALQANGSTVQTIEDEGSRTEVSVLQQAFIDASAVQCGFAHRDDHVSKTFAGENTNPTAEEIKTALSGNICRCTGYVNIIKAIQLAAERLKSIKVNEGEYE